MKFYYSLCLLGAALNVQNIDFGARRQEQTRPVKWEKDRSTTDRV